MDGFAGSSAGTASKKASRRVNNPLHSGAARAILESEKGRLSLP
jgi:hypothetical protein